MPYDPDIHHRRSIRLDGFNYSRRGAYFVTVCTADRQCLFGNIAAGTLTLNEWGQMVASCWSEIPRHYPHVGVDEFVVMPNHVHGVLMFDDARAGHAPPLQPLGTILGSFKAAATRAINSSSGTPHAILWQRNYFEHVVRDDESLESIREYIRTNPDRWDRDAANPHGDGSDDVEKWVAARAMAAKAGARKRVVQSSVVNGPDRQAEDGACPAPTRQDARAGHAPPLQRIGHGYDIHRLQPGGRLVLGGVTVANDVSPIAHSDGDVVIHSLVDAILGAMAWGDIGDMFPNDDARWKNADSQTFLRAVHEKLSAAGFSVMNADITILAERPKLKPFKSQMAETLRSIVGGQINIKAGTNEGCDAVGRGEAIACHAVVLVWAMN